MIQPQPYTAKCPKCNYIKLIKQKSDVIDPSLLFCPKCKAIMSKTDNGIDILTGNIKSLFYK